MSKSKKSKKKVTLTLPTTFHAEDYHDGPYIEQILGEMGLEVKVEEMGFDENEGAYEFEVLSR